MIRGNHWRIWVPLIVALTVSLCPIEWLFIPGISSLEQRVLGLFLLAVGLWLLEPFPHYVTSLLILFLLLLFMSNKGFPPFPLPAGAKPLAAEEIIASLSNPVIILFLAGYFLAIAGTKFHLDEKLAHLLLKPFGQEPRFVLLGLLCITGLLSAAMSNTATTALMLTIIHPFLRDIPAGDPARKAFLLAIPFAANIGGIVTPIGTPPNAIALKYLTGPLAISFPHWLAIAFPLAFILLAVSWLTLQWLFPSNLSFIKLSFKKSPPASPQSIFVTAVFALTVLLWMTDFLHGIDSLIISFVPLVLLSATQLINARDLREIDWDVLWLVSGGIALGSAVEKSGLSRHLVAALPLESFPPAMVITAIFLIAILMSSFISHTATANLILPLASAIATATPGMADWGGARVIILGVTFCTSMAMALPISTPPNALAFATGEITNGDMLKAGLIVGGSAFFLILILLPLAAGLGIL